MRQDKKKAKGKKRVDNYKRFTELNLGAIKPKGWLREFLIRQRDGLTGHLEAAGFPFETTGWAGDEVAARGGENWWPYEQYAYWVDGMIRCGYLLEDAFLIEKANAQIDYVMDKADADYYLGPAFLKEPEGWHRWPHAVFFRAMMARHSATGDDHILHAIAKHYLMSPRDHSDGRNICNIEPMIWAYELTGDKRLVDMAVWTYRDYEKRFPDDDTTTKWLLSERKSTVHGVTFCEQAKLPAILFTATGDERHLAASVNGFYKVDRDQMLVSGVCSSTEKLKGRDPLDSHETCDIADFTWSMGYMLMATGDPQYADKLERAVLNAAPGAVTNDFKALQYFSCPNQVVASRHSNHNEFHRGAAWMSYRPNPGTECCPGEVNRIMPNYVSRMWMKNADGGLAAMLYGPCEVTFTTDSGEEVTISESTNFPFDTNIELTISCQKPVEMPLSFRIPGWCECAQIYINGICANLPCVPSSLLAIRRTFEDGDRIVLEFPQHTRMTKWPRGGVALEHGPIVYSLPVKEDRQIDMDDKKSTPDFPAYNIYPASDWNYALEVDGRRLQKDTKHIPGPESTYPWDAENPPATLKVKGRKVRNWRIVTMQKVKSPRERGGWVEGDIRFTPQLPPRKGLSDRLVKASETLTLVPLGCTQLRMTVFPRAPKTTKGK